MLSFRQKLVYLGLLFCLLFSLAGFAFAGDASLDVSDASDGQRGALVLQIASDDRGTATITGGCQTGAAGGCTTGG